MNKPKYDAVVIGSGAGGASISYYLAKEGKKVLILERGSFAKQHHIGSFNRTVISPGYYDKFAALNMSKEFTSIYTSSNIGGSTVFSCGNMVPCDASIFKSFGIHLENQFKEIEEEIAIRDLSKKELIGGTKQLLKTSNKLKYNMQPSKKGFNKDFKCNLCGDCVLGCRKNAKWDSRTHVEKAINAGADLQHSITVQKVLLDKNHQVYGVEVTKNKKVEIIYCDKVVVSAGGLGTPVILLNSDISAGNGLFIDYLNATHGFSSSLDQSKGMTMGATAFFPDEGFLLSTYIDHFSQTSLFCSPLWSMKRALSKDKPVGVMTKISDERTGKVFKNGTISKKPTKQDRYRLDKGAKASKKILTEIGATSITTTTHPRGSHPGGTAAIGEVVDEKLQVKGTKGLYACDASVLPKPLGVPPIFTILALSKWLSEKI